MSLPDLPLLVSRIFSALALTSALIIPGAGFAQSFTFAAIGDVPYGPHEEFASLIEKLNGQPLAFTLHVGDIKSGSTVCSDETFLKVRELFEQFDRALIYTPGDNEWTDCHRVNNGRYDPLERLEKIRQLFFASNESLGKQRMTLQTQSSQKSFVTFVENRRWSQGKVRFATLHLVGSNNNLQPGLPSSSEFAAREHANIAWLRETFAEAKANADAAVVLAMQADTFFGEPRKGSGFVRWNVALAEEVAAWGKPVLLIQGDTHQYLTDRPLKDAKGRPLTQLVRIVVPGESQPDAVLISIDTADTAAPFQFKLLRAETP
ncbi:MAG: hypothetical protein RI928_2298 [Pseudomonadota bacterium]|jgi:hypothetical protein